MTIGRDKTVGELKKAILGEDLCFQKIGVSRLKLFRAEIPDDSETIQALDFKGANLHNQ